MGYLETINHPLFRDACEFTRYAFNSLKAMGLSDNDARGWIEAWASGAGDPEGEED